jgi:hypothetical protein
MQWPCQTGQNRVAKWERELLRKGVTFEMGIEDEVSQATFAQNGHNVDGRPSALGVGPGLAVSLGIRCVSEKTDFSRAMAAPFSH